MTIMGRAKANAGKIVFIPKNPLSSVPSFLDGYRMISMTIDAGNELKTTKQNATFWSLTKLWWQCDNDEQIVPFTDYEKRLMGAHILYEFAPKIIAKDGELLPCMDIKLLNKRDTSLLIGTILMELAIRTDKPYSVANEVKEIFLRIESYNAALKHDYADYADEACTIALGEQEWRSTHLISQASGEGGTLHLHHIHSRKARPDLASKPWNWLMMTAVEHQLIHNNGQVAFLRAYPHLDKRFVRADRLANKGE